MRGLLYFSFVTLFIFVTSFAQTKTTEKSHLAHSANWEVFPNPFYNTFTVASESRELEVDIYDLQGHRIPATIFRFNDGSQNLYQTGLELSKGLYLVRVSEGAQHRVYKMMKL